MESFGSGMTASGVKISLAPIPSHTGHAPYGLLKEKFLGSSSPNERLQVVQARCSESCSSLQPDFWFGSSTSRFRNPVPFLSAIRRNRQPFFVGFACDQPIDDCFNRIRFVLAIFGFVQRVDFAVSRSGRNRLPDCIDISACSPFRPLT